MLIKKLNAIIVVKFLIVALYQNIQNNYIIFLLIEQNKKLVLLIIEQIKIKVLVIIEQT